MHKGTSVPLAVVVAGSAGAGKTSFAAALARRLGAAVLDLDATYGRLVPLLRPDVDQATRRAILYAALCDSAVPSLAAGTSVLLVAPWTTERRDPEAWTALASALAASGGVARLVWVRLDPSAVLARLRDRGLQRDAEKLAAPERWLGEARPDEPPAVDHLAVDGARPVDAEARRVAGLLSGRDRRLSRG